MEFDNAEERYCLQCLAELRRSYERDAKPYLDRLTAIKSMQRPEPIVLTVDQAREYLQIVMT